jgi:hypothetical protein
MLISDLSHLELTSASTVEGGDNSAYVSQYASSAAGNNSGYFNSSYFNTALSKNMTYISQNDSDHYGYPYYYYW